MLYATLSHYDFIIEWCHGWIPKNMPVQIDASNFLLETDMEDGRVGGLVGEWVSWAGVRGDKRQCGGGNIQSTDLL